MSSVTLQPEPPVIGMLLRAVVPHVQQIAEAIEHRREDMESARKAVAAAAVWMLGQHASAALEGYDRHPRGVMDLGIDDMVARTGLPRWRVEVAEGALQLMAGDLFVAGSGWKLVDGVIRPVPASVRERHLYSRMAVQGLVFQAWYFLSRDNSGAAAAQDRCSGLGLGLEALVAAVGEPAVLAGS